LNISPGGKLPHAALRLARAMYIVKVACWTLCYCEAWL